MSSFLLTSEQDASVKGIKEWFNKKNKSSCTLVGYAGTGKTFLVNYIINELGLKPKEVAFCAFTGKAALLLKKANKDYNCSTIHRLIYELITDSSMPYFDLKEKEKLKGIRLIVIDEGSMITRELYEDILSFDIPVLVIGDPGQLPPIGDEFNLLNKPDFSLTQIHRQAEGNPIIFLSMLARQGRFIQPGAYGKNAYVLKRKETRNEILDRLYINANQVICGYNSTRKSVNKQVRRLLGFKETIPEIGDKMICLKNSWDREVDNIPLVNGLIGYIEEKKEKFSKDKVITKDCISVDFRPEFLSDKRYENLLLLVDDFTDKKVNLLREEISLYERMDYGYCITAHKAQGSSWDQVLVISEVLNSKQHDKWLYTAITRASDKLILLV